MRRSVPFAAAIRPLAGALLLAGSGGAGHAAPPDWPADRPGLQHEVRPDALPKPYATRSASNGPSEAPVPPGALPKAPPGFTVTRFASGLDAPRAIRVAPNGDVFVAETAAGTIHLLRAKPGAATAELSTVFASDLDEPFGIAFYPPGPDPQWIYIANTNSVVRYPYRNGQTQASGVARTVVAVLAGSGGGHSTRDIRFSPDGARMFVSVGSASNVAEDMPRLRGAKLKQWIDAHPLGAAWGDEEGRADVLSFDPEGGGRAVFATGLRNCVGLAVQPRSGDLWCATNERDGLGDDLVPDYVTRVRAGGYYGWPWYYLGDHEEPRLKGARPDLAGKATVPDVLLQAHSAALGIAFYDAAAGAPASFPSEYAGDAFVTMHGSWNRSLRTGYKLVRIRMKDGAPAGGYQDFLTGFVLSDAAVFGRPVGVAVAGDGAVLVSEDANGTVYRVAPAPQHAAR